MPLCRIHSFLPQIMAPKIDENSEEEISRMESGVHSNGRGCCHSPAVVTLLQKVVAELFGTYFVIFSGCGSVAVNKLYGGTITFPGICVTWGLIVMVMIYTVGHISGAHFNPAVTITNFIFGRLPWKEVVFYIIAQLIGSILASWTLSLMFDITKEAYFGTLPVGSNGQSFFIETIISFLLMFVISGAGTDTRSIGDLSGVAVGMTIMLNVLVAGPISGASMNPARSFGPALVRNEFRSLWVYIFGPLIGMIVGAFVYNMLRHTNQPFNQLTRSISFLKGKTKDDFS